MVEAQSIKKHWKNFPQNLNISHLKMLFCDRDFHTFKMYYFTTFIKTCSTAAPNKTLVFQKIDHTYCNMIRLNTVKTFLSLQFTFIKTQSQITIMPQKLQVKYKTLMNINILMK